MILRAIDIKTNSNIGSGIIKSDDNHPGDDHA